MTISQKMEKHVHFLMSSIVLESKIQRYKQKLENPHEGFNKKEKKKLVNEMNEKFNYSL